jgi:hypothetical protein
VWSYHSSLPQTSQVSVSSSRNPFMNNPLSLTWVNHDLARH